MKALKKLPRNRTKTKQPDPNAPEFAQPKSPVRESLDNPTPPLRPSHKNN